MAEAQTERALGPKLDEKWISGSLKAVQEWWSGWTDEEKQAYQKRPVIEEKIIGQIIVQRALHANVVAREYAIDLVVEKMMIARVSSSPADHVFSTPWDKLTPDEQKAPVLKSLNTVKFVDQIFALEDIPLPVKIRRVDEVLCDLVRTVSGPQFGCAMQ